LSKYCPLIKKEYVRIGEAISEEESEEPSLPQGYPKNNCESLCGFTKKGELIGELANIAYSKEDIFSLIEYSKEDIFSLFEDLIKVLLEDNKYQDKEISVNVSGKAINLLTKKIFSEIGEIEEDISGEYLDIIMDGPLVHLVTNNNIAFDSFLKETLERMKRCFDQSFWKISNVYIGAATKEDPTGWLLTLNFPDEEIKEKGVATLKDEHEDFRSWCDLRQKIAFLLKKRNNK